jgi:head-tail adaptor
MRTFGMLRGRVELQTAARTPTGKGGSTAAWSTVATVRGEVHAAVRDVLEGEAGATPTVAAQAEYVVELGTHKISGAMRLKADGRLYEILSLSRQGTMAFGRAREVD